tara:strand:- start:4548 stop:5570 length:1023 start_codon:yes stop_codon:yes gene_type:complete
MHIEPTVRKMLAAQNPEKVDVPIVFTELGCSVKKGADVQAHTLVKAYTMSIAQGIACVHWFEGRDGDSGPLGLLDRKGNPRPSYHALGHLIQYLGQEPEYLGWIQENESQIGFVFAGREEPVLVIWDKYQKTREFDFGAPVRIVNLITGTPLTGDRYPLTSAPVLVTDLPEHLVNQARENRANLIPWGGNFADQKTVSLTMGDEPVAKGLHTRSGESVAEAVTGYGGSARAGGVPGGNLFIVDPGFMTYTSEPIEIKAVVRRNSANDNAGFKLVYESTDGFKTAGHWYTIPDNKKWHTVTWRIDDPQFVRYWGYNFALESDGSKYNKYYIQSVSVTKLGE